MSLVSPRLEPGASWTIVARTAGTTSAFSMGANVALDTILLDTPSHALSGTILVRNLAFEKDVFVRLTLDDWRTHRDIRAPFAGTVCPTTPDGFHGIDRFFFRLDWGVLGEPPGGGGGGEIRVVMAVCCRMAGGEFWDNNRGVNHCAVLRLEEPPAEGAVAGTKAVAGGTTVTRRGSANAPAAAAMASALARGAAAAAAAASQPSTRRGGPPPQVSMVVMPPGGPPASFGAPKRRRRPFPSLSTSPGEPAAWADAKSAGVVPTLQVPDVPPNNPVPATRDADAPTEPHAEEPDPQAPQAFPPIPPLTLPSSIFAPVDPPPAAPQATPAAPIGTKALHSRMVASALFDDDWEAQHSTAPPAPTPPTTTTTTTTTAAAAVVVPAAPAPPPESPAFPPVEVSLLDPLSLPHRRTFLPYLRRLEDLQREHHAPTAPPPPGAATHDPWWWAAPDDAANAYPELPHLSTASPPPASVLGQFVPTNAAGEPRRASWRLGDGEGMGARRAFKLANPAAARAAAAADDEVEGGVPAAVFAAGADQRSLPSRETMPGVGLGSVDHPQQPWLLAPAAAGGVGPGDTAAGDGVSPVLVPKTFLGISEGQAGGVAAATETETPRPLAKKGAGYGIGGVAFGTPEDWWSAPRVSLRD
ncbi:hypothetical protein HDU96_002612 [Phlyctochytrium bullatum]|nr:hypothetical protein HDU96_002612 [Phlyctochytrium bullatum]